MSVADTVIRRWFLELWNKGKIELFPQLAHPDVVFYTIGTQGEQLVGLKGFHKLYDPLRAAFSDIAFVVEETIESGDSAAVRWSCTMKHVGDQMGVRASGRTVRISGMGFVHFRDGKVTKVWDEWDRLGFAKQIGVPLQA